MPGEPEVKMAPPDELTQEQARDWRDMVSRLPADWIGEDNAPLLCELVRHRSYSRATARAIDAVLAGKSLNNVKVRREFIALARLHLEQSDAVVRISTKLRITPQSQTDSRMAKIRRYAEPKPGVKVWHSGSIARTDKSALDS